MNITKPGATATIDLQKDEASSPIMSDDQKVLRHLVNRRHPEYEEHTQHWKFLESTYEGGREWFLEGNVFRYIKEGDGEYGDRVKRAYRFNHTKEVVDLLNKYLFKQNITRNTDDAPECIKRFWESSTKNNLGIRDFMRQAARKSSISGRVAIVVDNNAPADVVLSKADERRAGVRTYAYAVGPTQILDFSWNDDDGELNWILLLEVARDDQDPLTSSGAQKTRWRLWTRQSWHLLEERQVGNTKKTRIVVVDEGSHNLNKVPVVLCDHIITDEDYVAPSFIDEIAYLDRAVANYLSNLDAIIQDQTFSQLVMPAQNVLPGSDTARVLEDMGTKRVFLYDGEGGGTPGYISPDPKQAQMVLAMVNKIINEIYHTSGLAGERTKEDNSVGIDNSSGVAKAYDFERVNALLQAKADSLEVTENRIAELVALWHGETIPEGMKLVSYPDNFDTRGLYDEFDIAARLMLIEAPDEVRREQMNAVIDKLFPQVAKAIKEKMIASLKEWPVDPVELAGQLAEATGAGKLTATTGGAKAPATANARPGQGSVSKDTK
jgi:hypothetical protein